jgi:hypothetical protein
MKTSRVAGIAGVVLAVTVSAVAVAGGGPAAAEQAPHVLSGVVLTSMGVPAAGAEVQVHALTTGKTMQEVVPFGAAVADEHGRFAVAGLPDDPAAVSTAGEVYLQLRAATEHEAVIIGVTTGLPAAEGRRRCCTSPRPAASGATSRSRSDRGRGCGRSFADGHATACWRRPSR